LIHNETIQKYDAKIAELRAMQTKRLAEIQTVIDRNDAENLQVITKNRSILISPVKQSFAIMSAVFQFRRIAGKIKVLDAIGIMRVACREGEIGETAGLPSRKWRFNRQSFLVWFNRHPKYHKRLASFIEITGKHELLTMQLNENYTVFHNSERISPPPVSINKS